MQAKMSRIQTLLLWSLLFSCFVGRTQAQDDADQSCVDRCQSIGGPGQCACDGACEIHNDCCPDVKTVCPDDYVYYDYYNFTVPPLPPVLCDPYDTTPDNETECLSCIGRCGLWGNSYQCSCSLSCGYFDDCCEDFQMLCPEEHQAYLTEISQPAPTLGEYFCEPETEIPDELLQCATCENKCGTTSEFEATNCVENLNLCSCDKFCGFHGDCCRDFERFCPQESAYFRQTSDLYPLNRTFRDFQCRSFPTATEPTAENGFQTVESFINNLMITTCASDGSECEFTTTLNEDVNTFVPMYDIHRGVHYISGQCALCNGAKDVKPWNVRLNCNRTTEPKDYTATGVVNSTESLADIKDTGECKISYTVSGERRTCGADIISTCDSSCKNEKLRSLCESDFQSLSFDEFGFLVYRNEYCAMCNKEDAVYCQYEQRCRDAVFDDWPEGSFSLTLVFDFDPRRGLTIGKHPPPECADGEVYVPSEEACRPNTCPSGFVLDDFACIPEPSNITAIITGTFSEEPTIQMTDTLHQDKTQLESNIQHDVSEIMETFNVTHKHLQVMSSITHANNAFRVENTIQCNCDYTSLFATNSVNRFKNNLTQDVRKQVTIYFVSKNVYVDSVETDIVFEITNASDARAARLECTWLVYQPNETTHVNNTVTVIKTGKTYESGDYEIRGNSVIVCETDLSIPDEVVDDKDIALDIITLICVGISIICLVIRIILQFFILSFKKRKGKLQLQLTIAFLIAFLALVIGPFLRNSPDACTTAAIILAYGFLAAFIWMNVIACETSIMFMPSSAFLRADEEDRPLVVHYACGWGIPLLLVIISIGMNYSDVDVNFRPEFGRPRCWYTERYAMLLYFGVPIMLSILLNIVFYIHTSINLRRAFKNSATATKTLDHHFTIYVRLFVIMGITWILGIISAFTGEFALQVIFVILNSLQGLFLFISFVCNKAVMTEIRNRRKDKSQSSTTPGKKTKSTPLPGSGSETANKSESKV